MIDVRAAALGLALAFAPAAMAQPAPASGVIIDDTCGDAPATLAADEQIVTDALNAIGQRGYPGLATQLDRLRAVADHLPLCFPQITRVGGRVVVRSNDPSEGLILSTLAATANPGAQISLEGNVYPLVLLLLASYDVEMRRYQEAMMWLDRGLALQPNNQELMLEYNAALLGLRRYEDSRALLQSMLDNPALMLSLNRATVYRGLGVTLIDMNRLDEAEAALRESDRLEPNNAATRNEIDYIAELRRGAPERPTQLTAPASDPK